MPTQMRRYELDPAHIDAWLEFFKELTPARAKFGYRLLSAFHDRANNQFTWFVEHDKPFAEADPLWVSSPERDALFAGRPKFALVLHVSEVEPFSVTS